MAQLKTQVKEEKKKKLAKEQQAEVAKLQLELLQLRIQLGHTYIAPQCNSQIRRSNAEEEDQDPNL